MNWLATTHARLRAFAARRKLDAEMDEEMRAHIELRTQANLSAGMSREEARRAALRQFGGADSIKEDCRDQRGVRWLETLAQDVRFGARQLLKNPGFTAAAVLTLALGIGANTAIFSVINGVLLRPLPYRDSDRLVTVCETSLKGGHSQVVVAPGNLRDWTERNTVFEILGGFFHTSLTRTGHGPADLVQAAWTTPNFFDVFGIPPALGRTFIADDKPPAGHRVVVLSHGYWQNTFGSDPAIIGQPITLSGLNYTVIGVMPRDFKVYRPAGVFGPPTGDVQPQLWAPYPGPMSERTSKFFLAFARLKPGITLAQAQTEIGAIAERLKQDYPAQQAWGTSVLPFKEQIVGVTRPALRLLLAVTGFVLLIACANVANLSLARSVSRAKEFAIRSALGASRRRLVRQLLIESGMLAILGGGLGLLLARWGLAGLTALQPAHLPRVDEIRLAGPVLGFTLLVALLTGVIFGLAPALQASRANLAGVLKSIASMTGGRRSRLDPRGLLVVAEVALAMMLLTGTGVLISSFVRLIRVEPGFRPEQLTVIDFSPAGAAYASDESRMRLAQQLRDRLQTRPGIKAVATSYGLPFGSMLNSLIGVMLEGGPTAPESLARSGWRVVSPGYFEAMGISLRTGRSFSRQLDTTNSPFVTMINETLSRKLFAGENPVGKRVQLFPISTNWHEIIGVIQDVKLTGLDAPATPEIYQADSQKGLKMFSLVIRSSLAAQEVEQITRSEVAVIDKDLPLFNVRTMAQAMNASVAPRRFTLSLVGLFAVLALALTAVGIYGMLSYSVNQRTRELGIRMALGASRHAVLRLMLGQGMRLALGGIGLGLAGSLALTRLIQSQLFEISGSDPLTLISVALLLAAVAAFACWQPARRAAQADPMIALRAE